MKTIQISRPLLQSLYGDSTESRMIVFSQFLDCHSTIKENLVSGYCSGSIVALKKLLHYHGPTFTYLGMPTVSDLFRQLEEQCVPGSDPSCLSNSFSVLIHFVNESREMIVRELEYLRQAA